MADGNLMEIESFVERVRARGDPAHEWRHIQRLVSFCKEVGPIENADM
jgi:hypothetical protein